MKNSLLHILDKVLKLFFTKCLGKNNDLDSTFTYLNFISVTRLDCTSLLCMSFASTTKERVFQRALMHTWTLNRWTRLQSSSSKCMKTTGERGYLSALRGSFVAIMHFSSWTSILVTRQVHSFLFLFFLCFLFVVIYAARVLSDTVRVRWYSDFQKFRIQVRRYIYNNLIFLKIKVK
jgi:hypothetical protein